MGWELHVANSGEKMRRSMLSRIEILQEARDTPCVCSGRYIQCAYDILLNNGIDITFATSVYYVLLQQGRGKYRNLMIVGPANCGKTLLMNPLSKIYDTFCNPATGTFAWVGAQSAEVIFFEWFSVESQSTALAWHAIATWRIPGALPCSKNTLFMWHTFWEGHAHLLYEQTTIGVHHWWKCRWARNRNDDSPMEDILLVVSNTSTKSNSCTVVWSLLCTFCTWQSRSRCPRGCRGI